MLLSQAVPTAINLGKAAVQGSKAKKLAQTERPSYEIPEAVKQQVNQARYLASLRELPGQNVMENRIGSNIGKGVSELKNVSANPADLASNVAKMYSSGNDAINDIGLQAGQQWLQNQSLLNQNLGMLGQYQDKQFDINQMQPYRNNMAASSALREGAFRNLSSAGQNIASGIGGYANMMYQQEMLNDLLKKSGSAPSTINEGTTQTSGLDADSAAQVQREDTSFGNYQNPVSGQTMSEAIQSPIVSQDTGNIDMNALIKELLKMNKKQSLNTTFEPLPR